MVDSTLKKLMQLIKAADQAELRRAAIRVAGAVGPVRDHDLVKTLLPLLDDSSPDLRLDAIEALGQLHAEEALPRLVELVKQGGIEVEAAARAAGRLGVRGTRAMGQLMGEAAPALRRRIAAALAQAGTESTATATAQALLDDDPSVVDAAARSLATEVAAFSAGQRRALVGSLAGFLQQKSRQPPLSAVSEAAIIRVLGLLHDPDIEEVYWERLDPGRPAPIRAAALHALGTQPAPTSDAKLQRLLACAADADFQIVAPALLILKNVPVSRKNVKHWQRLLEAPDVATRRFAVDKLRDVPGEDVAQDLVAQLRHPDRSLREEALAVLRGSPSGRQALLAALLQAATVEEAWSLARAQADTAQAAPERERLLEQACRYQDQEDRRAEPLWFLLRETDHDWTRTQLEERALARRKKRDYAGALAYLRLLTRDPACGEEVRFEVAALGLKQSRHDPSAAVRQADPSLGQFARLAQNSDFDLIGHVTRARWLDAEDLFYLGFHFAEQTHQAREFGRAVLQLLIQRAPRTELARSARSKLKSEGLL